MNKKITGIFTASILLMFFLIISIDYFGSTDIHDYADVAKFFTGEYKAKIRSSHSYFYGFMSSPFVKLTSNFLGMKIMTFFWMILLMLSIYYISKKDKRTLLFLAISPIFWYMAPWINSIQISSLFFLWGYFFIKKYETTNKLSNLIYSGIFVGISWIFWDTILYFGIILSLCFLWNKKFSHYFLFILFVFIGLTPRLILDQILFNFPFYSILKSFFGGITNSLWNGISGEGGHTKSTIMNIFLVILMLPLFSHKLLIKKKFIEDKKTSLFLIFSLFLILTNPQIRYTLILTPIIILFLLKDLSNKEFKIYSISSLILVLLVLAPYLIQINYSVNNEEFNSFIQNFNNLNISKENYNRIIIDDLKNISNDFPYETFVVGNHVDYYGYLAYLYWGDKIKEFVSIQDYKLYLENKSVIFETEFHPTVNIQDRREIWIRGGISKIQNDLTDYPNIIYAISNEKEIDLNDFKLIKSYRTLNVFKKVKNE